jgi:hypothetical protein
LVKFLQDRNKQLAAVKPANWRPNKINQR